MAARRVQLGYARWEEHYTPEGYKEECMRRGVPRTTFYYNYRRLKRGGRLIVFLDREGGERLLLLDEAVKVDYDFFGEVRRKLTVKDEGVKLTVQEKVDYLSYICMLKPAYMILFSVGVREVVKACLLDPDMEVQAAALRVLERVAAVQGRLLQGFEEELVSAADDIMGKAQERERDQLLLFLLTGAMTEKTVDKALDFVEQRNTAQPGFFKYRDLVEQFSPVYFNSAAFRLQVKGRVKTWVAGPKDEELKRLARFIMTGGGNPSHRKSAAKVSC